MPLSCTFVLNGREMSTLDCGDVGRFPAFSGYGNHRNSVDSQAVASSGPIPLGKYYIVTRAEGLYERMFGSSKETWLALHRNDGAIDDVTMVGQTQRGEFRLHPSGPRNISLGCVTLPSASDFSKLREGLLARKGRLRVGNGFIDYFGTIAVVGPQ